MTTSNLSVGQITGSATNSGVINLPTANKIVGADSGSIRAPGTILQVVQGSLTGASAQITTSSASFVSSGIFVNITPLYNSSKILINCQITQVGNNSVTGGGEFAYYRNGTSIYQPAFSPTGTNGYMYYSVSSANAWVPTVNMQYLDSPASTSTQTYAIYWRNFVGILFYAGGVPGAGTNYPTHTITVMEVAA
jgi:hypothetical protein